MRIVPACFFMIGCLFLFFTAGGVNTGAAEARGALIGRISAVHGKVVFSAEKPVRQARLFDMVKEGDQLTLAPGGKARIIYYSTYNEEEIRGRIVVAISCRGTRLISGKSKNITTIRKSPQAKIAANPAGRGKEIASGVSKIMPLNHARYSLFPVSNLLEGGRPISFTWNVPGKEKIPWYRVSLIESGTGEKKLVDRLVVTDNSFTVPETAGPLAVGSHYSLAVEGFLIDPSDMKAEFPEYRVAATNSRYTFTMPSKSAVSKVKSEEKRIERMKEGSDEWISLSLYLFNLYLEYGADDRAARVAQAMGEHVKNNSYLSESPFVRELIKCYGK